MRVRLRGVSLSKVRGECNDTGRYRLYLAGSRARTDAPQCRPTRRAAVELPREGIAGAPSRRRATSRGDGRRAWGDTVIYQSTGRRESDQSDGTPWADLPSWQCVGSQVHLELVAVHVLVAR